uniref:Putative conserved secreted protein n=1 Tax=Ornithodoros turicata TaxID=34597 RepID=A0A2R5LHQ0_9ACAR
MTHLASFLIACLSVSFVFSQRQKCSDSVPSWDAITPLNQVVPFMRYLSENRPADNETCLFFDSPFSYPHSKTQLRSNTYGGFDRNFRQQEKRRMYGIVNKNIVKVLSGVLKGLWNLVYSDHETCIVTQHDKMGHQIWVRHDREKPYEYNPCCMFKYMEEVESDSYGLTNDLVPMPTYHTPYEDQKCRSIARKSGKK